MNGSHHLGYPKHKDKVEKQLDEAGAAILHHEGNLVRSHLGSEHRTAGFELPSGLANLDLGQFETRHGDDGHY